MVVVTPKRNSSNNHSGLSESGCNAITAWVEVGIWEGRRGGNRGGGGGGGGGGGVTGNGEVVEERS